MADDKELATALRQAKSKPMFFAFIAKGTEGKLLVEKKKVSAKDISDAKKELGGGMIFRGRAKGEEGTIVFELAKEAPGTLAALTKKIIKRDAGLTLDVEYRVAADLEEEGEETQTEEVAQESVPPAPPVAQDQAATRFSSRLKALAPVLSKAEAANAAVATQAKGEIAAANKLFLAKQYDDANAALDRAEALIKQAFASQGSAAPPSAPPPPPDSADKRAMGRVKALEPVLKKVATMDSPQAKQVMQAFKQVTDSLAKKDFASANSGLDTVESLIKLVMTAQSGGVSLVKLGKARVEWNGVRQHAVSEFERLKNILQAEYKGDPDEQETLTKAMQRLDSMVATMNEELGNELDKVLNADPAQRPSLTATAKSVLARFKNFVETDKLMSVIDGIEYAPDMQVAAPLRAKLNDISAALG